MIMEKPTKTSRRLIFYVVHFNHDEYLKDYDRMDFTTLYTKAQRFMNPHDAISAGQQIIKDYEPEDIGHFLSIVQVTIDPGNKLKTALRRIRILPF